MMMRLLYSMKIKKQPIISWLLDKNNTEDEKKIGIPIVDNKEHFVYLNCALNQLADVRDMGQEWGLPEIIMPSFEKVMEKSTKSFLRNDKRLFQEFYDDGVSGILISEDLGTIVYGFGEKGLYVWVFKQVQEFSQLYLYFYVESAGNKRAFYTLPTLLDDDQLFSGDKEERKRVCSALTSRIIIYLAVKKYVKVETVKIPSGKIVKFDKTICEYKHKEKVVNESGQEVVVLDSRWFRKIINDNNIFVRGFFRFQNKKNEKGEWCKELIFVDSYIRNGYHRNAKIEDRTE